MKDDLPGATHIVLADDDEDDYLFLKSATAEASCPVKITHVLNWLELLRQLNKTPLPDVIFLDLNMPVKNGFECLQLLREEKKFDNISIIIYTTSAAAKDVDEAYRLGANYYVVKPSAQQKIATILNKIGDMEKQQLLAKPGKEYFVLS